MWEPWRLKNLRAFKVCYRDSGTCTLPFETRCYMLRTFSGISHVAKLPVVCRHWPKGFLWSCWNSVLYALHFSLTCQNILCFHAAIKKTQFDTLFSEDDRLCGLVVRVLGYRSGGPGSIPGTTKKKMWFWNGVHSASWVQLRSYLIEK
jgi:hypothetical protein